ncbi:Nn.00g066120.m01.CDS01 [Neocucurbitaria sp. VM-36]
MQSSLPYSISALFINKPELAKYIRYVEGHECASGQKENLEQLYTHADLLTYERFLASAEWNLPSFSFSFSNGQPRGLQALTTPDMVWHRLWRVWLEKRLHFAVATLIALAENLDEAAISFNQASLAMLAFKRYPVDGGLRFIWLKDYSVAGKTRRLSTYKARPTPSQNPLAGWLHQEFFSSGLIPPWPTYELEEIALDLDLLDMDMDHLGLFFRYLNPLKRFACRWTSARSNNPDSRSYLNGINLPAMRRALIKFETSLTNLTINTMESSWQVDMDADIPAFGSFREFVVLQYLDVSGLVLWGDCDNVEFPRLSTMLPSSLETLKIHTEWDYDVEDAFYNLCEDGRAPLPHLKRVECTWDPSIRTAAQYLVGALKSLGVEFVVRINEDHDPLRRTGGTRITINND